MGSLRQSLLREAPGDPSFWLFLAALTLCLFQSADQPGFDLGFASTTLSVVPADIALLALAAATAVRLIGRRAFPPQALWLTVAALVFAALVFLTAVANGSTAAVAGAKLVELAALMVGRSCSSTRRSGCGSLSASSRS